MVGGVILPLCWQFSSRLFVGLKLKTVGQENPVLSLHMTQLATHDTLWLSMSADLLCCCNTAADKIPGLIPSALIADGGHMTCNAPRWQGSLLLPLILFHLHLPLEDLLLPSHFNHMYLLARGE